MTHPLSLLLAAALLTSCSTAEYQRATGLTPGQTLLLTGETLAEYERLRKLNQTSAKAPLADLQPAEPDTALSAPWWHFLLGLLPLSYPARGTDDRTLLPPRPPLEAGAF